MSRGASNTELATGTIRRIAPAIIVHMYTGLGCLFGFLAVAATSRKDFPAAFLNLAVATWIDYTDGTLARRYHIRERLPQNDGALLDRVVDFLVVVVLPILLLYQSRLIQAPRLLWISAILGVALFRFSRTFDPWIKDGFNWGLPAFWLFPVFYIFFLRPSAAIAGAFLAVVGILGCMPLGHIHPAIFPRLKTFNISGLLFWWAVYILVTQDLIPNPKPWVLLSLWYPVAYLLASWVQFRRYLGERPPSRNESRG